MIVRSERTADREVIDRVVARAFGREDEARLVDRLRADGDVMLSLVAEDDHGGVVGHVLLSRLSAPFRALALAPVSVSPERQNAGVGSALVRQALAEAAAAGWEAVFVLGEPAYYGRFGFTALLAAGFESPFAGEHFMAIALRGELSTLTGRLRHAPAFFG